MANLALAAQRQENYSEALKWADKALRCGTASQLVGLVYHRLA